MGRRIVSGKWPLLGVAAIIVVALAAVLVTTQIRASHGDPDIIQACVNNSDGTVRIIDAGGACLHDETPTSWNIEGPAGPQGPQGLLGPKGLQGELGPQGASRGARETRVTPAFRDPRGLLEKLLQQRFTCPPRQTPPLRLRGPAAYSTLSSFRPYHPHSNAYHGDQ